MASMGVPIGSVVHKIVAEDVSLDKLAIFCKSFGCDNPKKPPKKSSSRAAPSRRMSNLITVHWDAIPQVHMLLLRVPNKLTCGTG